MKKFLTFVLVLAMVLSVSSFAMAAEMTAAELKTALENAANGDTVTVGAEITGLEQVVITGNKTVTLDIGNNNVTSNVSGWAFFVKNGAKLIITGTGKITTSSHAFWLNDTTVDYNSNTGAGHLEIGSGVSVKAAGFGVSVVAGSTLTTAGNIEATGEYAAIQGNGNDTVVGTTITITDGRVENTGTGLGIYHPQVGVLNVNGGTIKGETGIEMRAGTLNVSGGTITATAAYEAPAPNGSGSTATGVAVAVSQHSTNKKITVNITGGTLNATGTDGKALYAYDVQSPGTGDESTLKIEGGTFNAPVVVAASADLDNATKTGFISGGEFSEAPAAALLDTNAVAVDNTEGGFKVLQEPDETHSPGFTVIPGTRNFGSTVQGTPFAAETFTVYNSGTDDLKVKLPEMENCTVKWADASFNGELTPISGNNYKADFTVQPNADLAAGEYTVKGVVKAEQYNDELDEGREITVKFTITAPATTPSSGSGYYGPNVWYIGGNTFGTNTNQVPTSVEIDQVPVSFTMNGGQITVDCITPGAKWVKVSWGSTTNTRYFTPDANAYCAQAVIPKTGGMSFWAAIAQFLGF